jgi:hypothetical protein
VRGIRAHRRDSDERGELLEPIGRHGRAV